MITMRTFRRASVSTMIVALTTLATANAAVTTRVGPDGGAVDWVGSDGQKIYAGTGAEAARTSWGPRILGGAGANLWISTDHGASWRSATPAEASPFRLSRDLRVADPNNRRVFYRVRNGYWGSAFQVSTDGGRTFTTRSRPIRGYADYVFVSALRTRPTTLLLNVVTNSSDPEEVRGLLRSVDGGRSWTKAAGLGATQIYSIWVDPLRPKRAFAMNENGRLLRTTTAGATWRTIRAPVNAQGLVVSPHRPSRILVSTASGVFRSTDSGTTWRRTSQVNLGQLSWDPVVPGDVFAGSPNGAGVSHDGGRTWTTSANGIKAWAAGDVQATNGRAVASSNSPSGPAFVSSTDNGQTWTALNDEPSNTDRTAPMPFLVSPTDPNRLVVTAPDGFAWSADGGTTWTSTGVPVTTLGVSSTGETFALGAYGRVVHATTIGDPFDFRGRVANYESGGKLMVVGTTLYVWSPNNLVMRSRDSGRTWSAAKWITDPFDGPLALAASAARPATLFAAAEQGYDPVRSRLWRSDDAGTKWRLITTVGLPSRAEWSALAVDQSDPDRLYVGSTWSGVWTSGDAGVHWTRITAAPRGVTSIRQDAALPTRLWIGTNGYGIWRVDL